MNYPTWDDLKSKPQPAGTYAFYASKKSFDCLVNGRSGRLTFTIGVWVTHRKTSRLYKVGNAVMRASVEYESQREQVSLLKRLVESLNNGQIKDSQLPKRVSSYRAWKDLESLVQ